jgi:hypothetical protein
LASGKTKDIGAYPALKLIELAGGTVKAPQPAAATAEASHAAD